MKNYLVIGGSSGIGKALVKQLTDEGHMVYATYNNNALEATHQLKVKHLDVLSDVNMIDFLPETLDGFVYCPGSIQLRPFSRIKPESFVTDFELQVVGAIKTLQMALPMLTAAESASVVFFSTVAVQMGFNFHTQVAASKGAVEGLTRSLAAELAPGIRVNAIAPSLTDTPLAAKLLGSDEKREANAQRHPLKKIGSPENIAQMAAFLLSEKSSWITGQIIPVDGGKSSINL
ncbi:MAG: SDR family oxidoreductase [Lentimicrobium sp.]|jgi:NAD(P)-dependent dehydrogenase (short-subunit alcohol dehydrogenase family)|nr:SDR family oxidoreductase [Lentimicrobium sp.]